MIEFERFLVDSVNHAPSLGEYTLGLDPLLNRPVRWIQIPKPQSVLRGILYLQSPAGCSVLQLSFGRQYFNDITAVLAGRQACLVTKRLFVRAIHSKKNVS